MIRPEFVAKYSSCKIPMPKEYASPYSVKSAVFCVDCVFQQARRGGKKCDEFIFLDLTHQLTGIYLVERKDTHSGNVTKVAKQLQGGADCIADFLADDPALDICKFKFLPVFVSLGFRGTSMRRKLLETKVRWRGRGGNVEYIRWIETEERKKPKLPKINL